MLSTALTAIFAIAILLGGWILVQVAWRRAFPECDPEEDALAGRLGCCQHCPREASCERREIQTDLLNH